MKKSKRLTDEEYFSNAKKKLKKWRIIEIPIILIDVVWWIYAAYAGKSMPDWFGFLIVLLIPLTAYIVANAAAAKDTYVSAIRRLEVKGIEIPNINKRKDHTQMNKEKSATLIWCTILAIVEISVFYFAFYFNPESGAAGISKFLIFVALSIYPFLVYNFCAKTRKLADTVKKQENELIQYKKREEITNRLMVKCKDFVDNCKSNITAIPYMAGIIAEIETRGYAVMAEQLNWGSDQRRLKKVASILDIKRDAKNKIMQAKQAEYQLKYLITMFPSLEDLLDLEFSQLPNMDSSDLSERDYARDYLSKEEWSKMSAAEKNQLALERYISSHNKTKWQIGRDYEEYVAYQYRLKGFAADTFGAYMGLEDMGRDIIATKENEVHIVQCKYWSSQKLIHEKHINQLFGTMTSYSIENEKKKLKVKGVFVTNICLSDTAKKFAERLNIEVVEQLEMGNFPRIKCNIGRYGEKIYHMPFDQQYDSARIDKAGEFYAMTVADAEKAGFRRAFKWHGNKS